MTKMAQEITYPKARSSRNSKLSSHSNINTDQDDEQSEMANPFLVNQSSMNDRTAGNLMIRWSDTNLDRKNTSDFIENPKQEISSLGDEVNIKVMIIAPN
jgi:hypothetical protein